MINQTNPCKHPSLHIVRAVIYILTCKQTEKKLMVEELALEDGLRSCFDSGELGLSLCFLVLEATTKQSFYLYRHGCLRKNVT